MRVNIPVSPEEGVGPCHQPTPGVAEGPGWALPASGPRGPALLLPTHRSARPKTPGQSYKLSLEAAQVVGAGPAEAPTRSQPGEEPKNHDGLSRILFKSFQFTFSGPHGDTTLQGVRKGSGSPLGGQPCVDTATPQ